MSLIQLQRLLPLPEADLQQVLDYASTLSKHEAAEHFNNLLGESPQSIEFISTFNARRQDTKPSTTPSSSAAASSSSTSEVPKPVRKQQKKKPAIHTPAARQVHDNYAGQGQAYKKQDEQDYMVKKPQNNNFALTSQPAATQAPTTRPPPSAAGRLISDDLRPSSKSAPTSRNASRNASPARSSAKPTKVSISGGTPMHGASTALNELDAAIRSLELQTNPSKSSKDNPASRQCNCMATRHPLLAAAPNCTNCGKIICVKEGLGPCTFCGTPLLSGGEIQDMIRSLKEERGKEKMALDASAHRKTEVSNSRVPAPFSAPRSGGPTPGEAASGTTAAEVAMNAAAAHRDRLLNFQAQNAKRTTVRDEAAEFETPDAGTSMWASPAERARQLKAQQRVMREVEWGARPEYDKRRQVVSLDLVGGKVVKRVAMQAVERPDFGAEEDGDDGEEEVLTETSGNASVHGKGTFARNPLLGGLIKPVYHIATENGKGKSLDMGAATDGEGENGGEERRRRKAWRRVQDDYEDNEEVILDGGIYGRGAHGGEVAGDEPERS